MTFQEFREAHGIRLSRYGTRPGCYHVFERDVPQDAKWDLYHLSDYYVAGVMSGPAYVLNVRLSGPEVAR